MAGSNFNDTSNKAVTETAVQAISNKTSYNGVALTNAGAGNQALFDDGNYKVPAGGGDVVGPAGAGDENIAVYDGVTGQLIKDGGKSIADIEAQFQPANVVFVNSKSDFPAPAAGVITLAASTTYEVSGIIDLGSDRIVCQALTALVGRDRLKDGLTSTTTGAVITSSATHKIEEFRIEAPSGSIFSLTGTTAETCLYTNVFVTNAVSVGTIDTWGTSVFRSVSAVNITTSGLAFNGANQAFNTNDSLWQAVGGTSIDLGSATFDRVQFQSGMRFVTTVGQTAISGLASSGNINPGGFGSIDGPVFDNTGGTTLNNITSSDLRWNIDAVGVKSTTKNSQGYNHILTTTTIGVGDGDLGNPKLMNGAANWVEAHADQFTVSTAGRMTYIGVDTEEFHVRVVTNGTTSSGSGTNYNTYIAVNGVVEVASKITREYNSGSNGTVTAATIVELSTNDYIEVFIENIDNTNNWESNIVNLIASRA